LKIQRLLNLSCSFDKESSRLLAVLAFAAHRSAQTEGVTFFKTALSRQSPRIYLKCKKVKGTYRSIK
jgi:hypothetical protein